MFRNNHSTSISIKINDSELAKRLTDYGSKSINVNNCKNLNNLSKIIFPNNIESFSSCNCSNLVSIPDLITYQNLKFVSLSGCIKLVNLSKIRFPAGIAKIYFNECINLTHMPDLSKCDNIIEISFKSCAKLTDLSKIKFSAAIQEVDFSGCINLTNIPHFSNCNNLKNISFKSCAKLTDLSKIKFFPAIEEVDFSGCTSLTDIPDFSNCSNLKKVDFSNCTSLPDNEEMLNKLIKLERQNAHNPEFRMIWPSHINRDIAITEAKVLLKQAYKLYYQNIRPDFKLEPNENDEANFPTFKLLHRYLTECLDYRGKQDDIFNFAKDAVQIIKNNPPILEVIDKISEQHLAACVNQPVAGFIQIANLVEIAACRDILSKINRAKNLLIIEKIKQDSIDLARNLGISSGVEVEFFNAMIAPVNNILYENGMMAERLKAIPEQIAYQRCVADKVNDKNIRQMADSAEKYIIENLLSEKALETILDYITNYSNLQDFWATQIIDKETLEFLRNNSATKITALRNQFDDLDLSDQIGNMGTNISKQIKEIEQKLQNEILDYSKKISYEAIKTDYQEKDVENIMEQILEQNICDYSQEINYEAIKIDHQAKEAKNNSNIGYHHQNQIRKDIQNAEDSSIMSCENSPSAGKIKISNYKFIETNSNILPSNNIQLEKWQVSENSQMQYTKNSIPVNKLKQLAEKKELKQQK